MYYHNFHSLHLVLWLHTTVTVHFHSYIGVLEIWGQLTPSNKPTRKSNNISLALVSLNVSKKVLDVDLLRLVVSRSNIMYTEFPEEMVTGLKKFHEGHCLAPSRHQLWLHDQYL